MRVVIITMFSDVLIICPVILKLKIVLLSINSYFSYEIDPIWEYTTLSYEIDSICEQTFSSFEALIG